MAKLTIAISERLDREIEELRATFGTSRNGIIKRSLNFFRGAAEWNTPRSKNILSNGTLEFVFNNGVQIPSDAEKPKPHEEIEELFRGSEKVPLSLSGIVIPERKVAEGLLVRSTSLMWATIVDELNYDWSAAYQIPPEKWEEIIAGAYKKAGYDEVILTPRSRDFGRDVIAVRKGIGCIKIIGSVKAYKPGHLVGQDHVRALAGVLSLETNASKGILSTTSDFAPRMMDDELIAKAVPFRLELMNGERLREWLAELAKK
jgi:restriction system protein